MAAERAESTIRMLNPEDDSRIVVNRLSGKEGVSRLFSFSIHLTTPRSETRRIDALLGQAIALEVRRSGGPSRQISGLVRRVRQVAEHDGLMEYSVTLVPPIWPLSQNRRSRLFRDLSTPDILKAVFEGFAVRFQLREEYLRTPGAVQYRESDFAFASRLMEEAGIYYYFEFIDAQCRLALADFSPLAPPVDGRYETRYRPAAGTTRHVTSVSEWFVRRQLMPNQVVVATAPAGPAGSSIRAESSSLDSVRVGANQEFLHPPGFQVTIEVPPADGLGAATPLSADRKEDFHAWHSLVAAVQRQAERRLQRWQCQSIVIDGASDCPHFVPGYQFLLSSAGELGGEYFITRVEHSATQSPEPPSQEIQDEYRNRFRCVPRDLPYRPPARTPQPRARGMMTAAVIGPTGSEIHTDERGRVNVRFDVTDEDQVKGVTSWLNVVQRGNAPPWIPRVGQQVLIDFVEGEVDRPIIVGTVRDERPAEPMVEETTALASSATASTADDHPPARGEMEHRLQKFTAEPPPSETKPRRQKPAAMLAETRPELPNNASLHQVVAALDDRKAIWVGCLAMAELVRRVASGNIPASQLGVVDEAAEWVITPDPGRQHAVEAAATMVSSSTPGGAIGQAVAVANNDGGLAQAAVVARIVAAIHSAAEQYLPADRRSSFEGQVLVIARDVFHGRQLWGSDEAVDPRSRFGFETSQ